MLEGLAKRSELEEREGCGWMVVVISLDR